MSQCGANESLFTTHVFMLGRQPMSQCWTSESLFCVYVFYVGPTLVYNTRSLSQWVINAYSMYTIVYVGAL